MIKKLQCILDDRDFYERLSGYVFNSFQGEM